MPVKSKFSFFKRWEAPERLRQKQFDYNVIKK